MGCYTVVHTPQCDLEIHWKCVKGTIPPRWHDGQGALKSCSCSKVTPSIPSTTAVVLAPPCLQLHAQVCVCIYIYNILYNIKNIFVFDMRAYTFFHAYPIIGLSII